MSGLRLSKGTTVVNLADGTEIGEVDRVYLDPERKEIVGFTIHRGGFLRSSAAGLVEVGDVHAFGPDAVTIGDAKAVCSEFAIGQRRGELVELGDLIGRKVVTVEGIALGSVAGVRFGEESFRLLALDVSPGPLKEHSEVLGSDVATIGEDLIVVGQERSAAAVTPPVAASASASRHVYLVEPGGAQRRLAG